MKHYLILNAAKEDIDALLSGERLWLPFSKVPTSLTHDKIRWDENGKWVLLQERASGGKIRAVAKFDFSVYSSASFKLTQRKKEYEKAPERNLKQLDLLRDLERESGMTLQEIDDFYTRGDGCALWRLAHAHAFESHVAQYYLSRAVSTYRFVYGEEVCALPSSNGEMVTLRGWRERERRIKAAINYGRKLERLEWARAGCAPTRKLVEAAWKARKELMR